MCICKLDYSKHTVYKHKLVLDLQFNHGLGKTWIVIFEIASLQQIVQTVTKHYCWLVKQSLKPRIYNFQVKYYHYYNCIQKILSYTSCYLKSRFFLSHCRFEHVFNEILDFLTKNPVSSPLALALKRARSLEEGNYPCLYSWS